MGWKIISWCIIYGLVMWGWLGISGCWWLLVNGWFLRGCLWVGRGYWWLGLMELWIWWDIYYGWIVGVLDNGVIVDLCGFSFGRFEMCKKYWRICF